MDSRHLRKGWSGDFPLNMMEWFEAERPKNEGGLRMIDDCSGKADTLGPCATRPPKPYRAPVKRCNGPTMIYPKTVEMKESSVKIIPQKNRWAEEEKPSGCRKFPPRERSGLQKEGGLRICYDEKTGEMFKAKRSQVMSFSDLTGTKRTFRDKPGFKDPSKQDPNAFPGLKGRDLDHRPDGSMIDFSLKQNGGFFGVKRLPDVVVLKPKALSASKPLEDATNLQPQYVAIGGSGGNGGAGPPGGGAPTIGPGAASHGVLGRLHHQGLAHLVNR